MMTILLQDVNTNAGLEVVQYGLYGTLAVVAVGCVGYVMFLRWMKSH